MTGNFIDSFRYRFKKVSPGTNGHYSFLSTDLGKIRVFDTKGSKPVLITVPDGPNVIEHHEDIISKLAKDYRVVCFEFFGLGMSYPNSKFDYSFDKAAHLIINVMDLLKIERATLCFSCSNGLYAIRVAELYPERIVHLFLSQTPSISELIKWADGSIPKILRYPIVGELVNAVSQKKLAKIWYGYALPRETDGARYIDKALSSLDHGGCFCLSGLVQGLEKESRSKLRVLEVPSTLIWGMKDYTHRQTNKSSILEHLPNTEIIEFENCGHFPELEDSNRYVRLLKEKVID